MTERVDISAWLDLFRSAWVGLDPEAISSRFSEDVRYQTSPFARPVVGRRAVVAHWRAELDSVGSADVSFGAPIVDGDRVAVAWESRLDRRGVTSRESGVLLLEFEAGLCRELQEYWMIQSGGSGDG